MWWGIKEPWQSQKAFLEERTFKLAWSSESGWDRKVDETRKLDGIGLGRRTDFNQKKLLV